MKFLVLFVLHFALTMAQRPTYAGSSPIGRPGLASRFKDTEDSTTVPFANRIGEDTSGTSIRIPVDARGDGELVNRLNQWPREHRPFWLLNADHIETHRHPQEPTPNRPVSNADITSRNNFDNSDFFEPESRPIRPTPSRSSFLGPLRR